MSVRTSAVSGHSPSQLTFSFVDPEQRLAMATNWAQSVEKGEQREAKRQMEARKRLVLKIVESKTLQIDWGKFKHHLDAPLIGYQPSDLDELAPDTRAHSKSLAVVSSNDVEESRDLPGHPPLELHDRTISDLHEKLLMYSLNILKSKGNAEEKFEILKWIWTDDIYCHSVRVVDGISVRKPVYRAQVPFTFQMCCAATGLHVDRMRDGLAYALLPTLKQMGLEFLID